jgi:hypothetical protein
MRVRVVSSQNLIADGKIDRHLSHTNQATRTDSNREEFRVSGIEKHSPDMNQPEGAKEKLIATVAKLKLSLTLSKHWSLRFSNRNKLRCLVLTCDCGEGRGDALRPGLP